VSDKLSAESCVNWGHAYAHRPAMTGPGDEALHLQPGQILPDGILGNLIQRRRRDWLSGYRVSFAAYWRQKRTEICIQLTWHSPSPTPLLPALTLSAGEYRVSGGELKVSRQVGLPRNPRARRPKMVTLYFWRPSQSSCRVAKVEPPVSYSYLESTVPAAACEVAISVRSAGPTCSTRLRFASCANSSGLPPLWEENRLETS
jgi:hypothetical protein